MRDALVLAKTGLTAFMERLGYWTRRYDIPQSVEQSSAEGGQAATEQLPRFRLLPFTVELALEASAWVLLFSFTLWRREIHLPPTREDFWLTVVMVEVIFGASGELFFHRYCLHGSLLYLPLSKILKVENAESPSALIRFWSPTHWFWRFVIKIICRMRKSHHVQHHGEQTPIKAKKSRHHPGQYRVESKYEIEVGEQTEHSTFWHGTASLFMLVFSLIYLPLQLALPKLPIVEAFLFVLFFKVWVYEGIHALMHVPYRKFWRRAVRLPLVGWYFAMVYVHHWVHHWVPSKNEGITGIFIGFYWLEFLLYGTKDISVTLVYIEKVAELNDFPLEVRPEQLAQWEEEGKLPPLPLGLTDSEPCWLIRRLDTMNTLAERRLKPVQDLLFPKTEKKEGLALATS